MNNLLNKRFGRLKVIEETVKRSTDRNIIWKCVCDCGNFIEVRAGNLTSGNTRSCGCLQYEAMLKNTKNFKSNAGFIEGTNASLIQSNTIFKNNKSGTRGVCWDSNKQKWLACINFKKVRYRLGHFKNKEDAILIRKKAEEQLYGEFLEWYENYKKQTK